MTDDLSPRRREILRAATSVLARSGSRGLTHRAVDREAGLAEGSTSAYFRSRDALVGALADFVARQLSSDVDRLAERLDQQGDDAEHLVSATARLFDDWLEEPTFLRARLELTVAATREQQLAERFLAWRLELVVVVGRILAVRRADSAESVSVPSAETLVAALDGVLMAAMVQPPQRRQAFVRESIHQLLNPLDDDR